MTVSLTYRPAYRFLVAKQLIRILLLTFAVSSILILWFALGSISRANTVLVTTTQDELDAGGTLTNPLGDGLSLREAIAWMNTEDTTNYVINFASNVSVISLTSALPEFSATCGSQTCAVSLMGENITLVGNGNFDALSLNVDGVKVQGINFKNFRHAITIAADNSTLENLIIEDSTQSQIQINTDARNVRITDSTVRSGDASGIELAAGADASSWQKVKVYDNATGNIILAPGANANLAAPIFSHAAFFPGPDGKVIVTGSGSQNGTIEFYLDNGNTFLGTGNIDGSGQFSVTLPASDAEASSIPASGTITAFQTANNRSSALNTPVPFMPFDVAASVSVDTSEIAPQETAHFQVILTNPLPVAIENIALEGDFTGLPPLTVGQPQITDSNAVVVTNTGAMLRINTITIPSGNVVTITIPMRAGMAKKGEIYQPKIRITAPQEKVLSVPSVIVENVAPQVTINPPNVTVNSGSGVTLTGTASDSNGDQITTAWSVVGGTPAITLTNSDQLAISFIAPQVTLDTVYILKLKVDDGTISSEALATVTVKPGNLPPVVEPMDIPVVRAGKEVQLTVQASDPNNDRLTYTWRQTSGSGAIVFTGSGSNTITFTAPRILTTTKYGFTVNVSDGKASSVGTAYVIVRKYRSESPIADAGPDQTVSSGSTVTLDGSKSKDADSLVLTYLWEQVDGTKVTFAPTLIKTTFTAPTVTQDEVLEFSLTVKDGVNDGSDLMRVLIMPKGKAVPASATSTPSPSSLVQNSPPAITITAPTTVSSGTTVNLDGSTTRDPEGQRMRYFWRVTNQTLAITNFDKAKASLKIPPDFKNNTKIIVELSVNDDKQQAKKTHEILVKGSAPVAASQATSASAVRDSSARTQPSPSPSSSPTSPSSSVPSSPSSSVPSSPSSSSSSTPSPSPNVISTLKRSDVISQAQKACFPNDPVDAEQKVYLDKVFLDMNNQGLDAVGMTKIDTLRDTLSACQVFPWKKRNEITTKDKTSGFTDVPSVDNTNPNYWWARYARFSKDHKLFKDKDATFEPLQPITQEDLDGLLRKIQKLLDADYQYLPFYSSLKILKTKLDTSTVDADKNSIPDFWEKKYSKDEKGLKDEEDPDADGLSNYQEYIFDTNPYKADTDGDDLEDAREAFLAHTDPNRFDTDSDGVSDFTELFVLDSNPREKDSDGDTFFDRFEGQDTDPSDDKSVPKDENTNGLPDEAEQKKNISYSEDDDNDGLNDAWEYYQGTDAKKKDSDGDKANDAEEILRNDTNPKDADSKPQKDSFKFVNLGSYVITSGQSLLVQTLTPLKKEIHIMAVSDDGKLQELAKGMPNKQGLTTMILNDISLNTIALVAVDNGTSQVTDRSPLVFVQVKQVDLAAPTITKLGDQDARDNMTIDSDKLQVFGENPPGSEVRLIWQGSTVKNTALLSHGTSGEFVSRLADALDPGEYTLYAAAIGRHGEHSSVTQMKFNYAAKNKVAEEKNTQKTNADDTFLASVFSFGAKPQTLITAILFLVGVFCIRYGLKQRKQKLIRELVEEKKKSQLTSITIPNGDPNEQ